MRLYYGTCTGVHGAGRLEGGQPLVEHGAQACCRVTHRRAIQTCNQPDTDVADCLRTLSTLLMRAGQEQAVAPGVLGPAAAGAQLKAQLAATCEEAAETAGYEEVAAPCVSLDVLPTYDAGARVYLRHYRPTIVCTVR